MKKTFLILVVALSAACAKTADDHARRAQTYVDQSKFPDAIIEYKNAVQLEPSRGDLHMKLADLYFRRQELANALKEYVRAADALPNDAEAQIKAASILVAAGQHDNAQARARKALAIDPKNTSALILLGNALAGLKDMEGAITEYQEALARDPSMEVAHTNLGTIQASLGQQAEAEANFRKAVEIAPASVPARMALANYFWATGRKGEAEQALKDVLTKDPANLPAARALGMLYMASNRAAEAEPYFQMIAKAVNTPATDLGLSDYYVATKRIDDAKSILVRLASQKETYAVATTRLAALDAAQGAPAQALVKLREVTDKYPRDTSARLLMARLLLADGKRDEALAQANTIVVGDATSNAAAEAHLLIAGIQTSLDRRDDAIKTYQEVLKRPTPDVAARAQGLAANVGLARLYLSAGMVDKAATHAQQALAIAPQSPDARSLMVRVYLAQNNRTGAQKALAQLQTEFPQSPTVLNLLAAQQLADGHADAARGFYAKAVALAPNDLEATAGLIRIDLATKRTKDALARVDAGLKAPLVTSDFLILAAQAYGTAGDGAKAEALLKQAIELEPNRLQAYNLLGGLYISQKRIDEAGQRFTQIIERDPKSVSANTMLGIILETQGRGADAEKQYQKVLAADPRAAVAANNLAWIYVASGRNLDQAMELAQAALQRLPDEPHINDTIGWIYYKKNMTASAIRHLEAGVRTNPDDPAGHYHLGMAYAQGEKNEQAKKELRRALEFKTDFDGAVEAKRMLQQLGG